jgi:glycogen(starch) synthase
MIDTYGENYFLLGPYFPDKIRTDFRSITDPGDSPLAQTIDHLRSLGFEIHYGYWLLDDSRPRVLLFNPNINTQCLNEVKTRLWEKYRLSTIVPDQTMDQVIGFGEIVRLFMTEYAERMQSDQDVLVHFHEWMSASALPELVDRPVRIATAFTTHATVLGRYLAPNEQDYFSQCQNMDWKSKSVFYGIETQVLLERIVAEKTHVFITDSANTARECELFLGRKPDSIIYNGINKRPAPRDELFQVYQKNREKIDSFVKALFLPSYPLQTDKTLYFFTSGRYEYRNKGFDITLEAMARLNGLLMQQKSDITIVLFIISKQPFQTIRPDVLEARQKYHDLRKICAEISQRLGPRLYSTVTNEKGKVLPNLNSLVDDELLLTWKQAVLDFKRNELPPITTHQLTVQDDITAFCHMAGLDNKESNRVKVIYHPDFMERARSLFSMDYQDFIKGCNLGIFPSLYEPWGYTPMETAMGGTPVITSDTSGFGQYISEAMQDPASNDMYYVNRRLHSDEEATMQLTDILMQFSESFIKEQYVPRAILPKQTTDPLCWTNLQPRYHEVYKLAFMRLYPGSGLY